MSKFVENLEFIMISNTDQHVFNNTNWVKTISMGCVRRAINHTVGRRGSVGECLSGGFYRLDAPYY